MPFLASVLKMLQCLYWISNELLNATASPPNSGVPLPVILEDLTCPKYFPVLSCPFDDGNLLLDGC